MEAYWAELPSDLLVLIAKRVKVIDDYIAFSAVCTSWRSVATKHNFDVLLPQVPLLMLADKEDNYREFYSLSKGKVLRKLHLPEARGCKCFHTEGWLMTVSSNGEYNLFNPFSSTQIKLPPRKNLLDLPEEEERYHCIDKAVLTASPSLTSDYVLVVSYYAGANYLAFWRPGDLSWTDIDINNWGAVTSISYYEGHFYAVTWAGEVWVFDIAGPRIPQPIVQPRLLVELKHNMFQTPSVSFYLVEVPSALLLVTRFSHGEGCETFKFEVSEFDVIKHELKEISTLGDSAIFVGRNGASSIDSSKFTGVKSNHIYFSDDWFEFYDKLEGGGGRDMGAYNLEDGTVESFYPGLSLSPICPPTWVTPSFR